MLPPFSQQCTASRPRKPRIESWISVTQQTSNQQRITELQGTERLVTQFACSFCYISPWRFIIPCYLDHLFFSILSTFLKGDSYSRDVQSSSHVHRCQQLNPELSQLNPVHILKPMIHFNIIPPPSKPRYLRIILCPLDLCPLGW